MPMENDAFWPMSREMLELFVNRAKSLPTLTEARIIIDLLNCAFRGVYNKEAFDMIDSITSHFKEESDQKLLKELEDRMDKMVRQHLNFPELDLTDEQIAVAIMQTVQNSVMQSSRDWAGIFRILVDKCHWSDVFKEFERRIQRMKEMGLLKDIPSDKDFDYQALQTGLPIDKKYKYEDWLRLTKKDAMFTHRRNVATTFYNFLKTQQNQSPNY